MAAVQPAENHDNAWGLMWYLQWEIYTVLTKTHWRNSVQAAEAHKIYSHGLSFKWSWQQSQLAPE